MDDFRPDDPLVRLRAEIDQAIALGDEIAKWAHGTYGSFKAAGFLDSQALYLTAVQLQGTPGTPPR